MYKTTFNTHKNNNYKTLLNKLHFITRPSLSHFSSLTLSYSCPKDGVSSLHLPTRPQSDMRDCHAGSLAPLHLSAVAYRT